MKQSSFLSLLVSFLLSINACQSFVVQQPLERIARTAKTSAVPTTSSSDQRCWTTLSSQLQTHAIGPQETVSMKGDASGSDISSTSSTSNDLDGNAAVLGSVAGLALVAMLLNMPGSFPAMPNMAQMDEGSAATLIVDAVVLAIALIASFVTGDGDSTTTTTTTTSTRNADGSSDYVL